MISHKPVSDIVTPGQLNVVLQVEFVLKGIVIYGQLGSRN